MLPCESLGLDQQRTAEGIAPVVAPGLPHLEGTVAGQDGEPARHRALGETRRSIALPGKIIECVHQPSVVGCQVTRLGPGMHGLLQFAGLLYRTLQVILLNFYSVCAMPTLP